MVDWGGVEDMGDENSIQVAMAMKLSASDKGSCHERTMRTLAAAMGALSTHRHGGATARRVNAIKQWQTSQRCDGTLTSEETRDSKNQTNQRLRKRAIKAATPRISRSNLQLCCNVSVHAESH